MKKLIFSIFCIILFVGCSKPIDEKMDGSVRALIIQLKTPGILDDAATKNMMCASVRMMMSALVSSKFKIQEKTNSEFNEYASLCNVEKYEN